MDQWAEDGSMGGSIGGQMAKEMDMGASKVVTINFISLLPRV